MAILGFKKLNGRLWLVDDGRGEGSGEGRSRCRVGCLTYWWGDRGSSSGRLSIGWDGGGGEADVYVLVGSGVDLLGVVGGAGVVVRRTGGVGDCFLDGVGEYAQHKVGMRAGEGVGVGVDSGI